MTGDAEMQVIGEAGRADTTASRRKVVKRSHGRLELGGGAEINFDAPRCCRCGSTDRDAWRRR